MVTLLQNGGRLGGVCGKQHWKVEGTIVGDEVKSASHPPRRPTTTSDVQSGTSIAVRK